jgi:hypothetical protein
VKDMWKKVDSLLDIEINENGELRHISTERPIKGYINPSGYIQINVKRSNGRRSSITLHRLMGEVYFNVISSGKKVINHIDGNKLNNNLSNLEVISASDNIKHAYRMGLNGHSSLNAEKVREIRRKGQYIKETKDYRNLSKEFEVSMSTIRSIINRNTWKHVE